MSRDDRSKYNEKIEYQECLEKGKGFFEAESRFSAESATTHNPVLGGRDDAKQSLLTEDFGARRRLDRDASRMLAWNFKRSGLETSVSRGRGPKTEICQ